MTFTINQLFHTTALLTYVFTVYSAVSVKIPIAAEQFKNFDVGQARYLTVWNLIIQTVFFLICIINDCFGTNAASPKKPPFIRRLKDRIHAVLAFPTAMFVATIFWSLYAVDRELVFPKVLDPYFPWWLNHLMHTMIMVSIIIETIITPRNYPKRLKGSLANVAFMLIYFVWMLIIYAKSGIWVYPIFHVLTLPTRCLFVATMLIYNIILYIFGETMDNFFWGNEYIKHQKSHAKSK
ncbi:androgen-dependent TFPI-regulating protein isoform X2 [Megachile rotundata]|uniref:androgen-dependent TFPI-regulating protein isoform X2 n=1 Tax=Megachile rotundata TaxID=143995 RepID=UPI003FD4EA06